MQKTESFTHLKYELLCTVMQVNGGRFAPNVVATAKTWPHRPRTLHIQPYAFDTEVEAFAAGRIQGISWVTVFG